MIYSNKIITQFKKKRFSFLHSGCIGGRYGENCKDKCPVNCLKDICDIFMGNCFQCDIGYKGPRCDLRKYKQFNLLSKMQIFF